MFGCISSEGWREEDGKDICLFNNDPLACKFGNLVGIFGFLGSIGLIVGEFLFERMSSVKSRKRFVLSDMAFSGKADTPKKKHPTSLSLIHHSSKYSRLDIHVLRCIHLPVDPMEFG